MKFFTSAVMQQQKNIRHREVELQTTQPRIFQLQRFKKLFHEISINISIYKYCYSSEITFRKAGANRELFTWPNSHTQNMPIK